MHRKQNSRQFLSSKSSIVLKRHCNDGGRTEAKSGCKISATKQFGVGRVRWILERWAKREIDTGRSKDELRVKTKTKHVLFDGWTEHRHQPHVKKECLFIVELVTTTY